MIGSELGSSLVNAMVSLAYSGKPEQFRRAFSAAILGDVFNICGLFVIFPMEMFTGLIEKVSWWIVDPLISEQGLSFKTLDLLTDPINQIILQVNEAELLNATIRPEMFAPNHSFVQRCSFKNGSRVYNCPYNHLFANTSLSDKNIGWIVLFISIFCLVMCLVGIVYLIQKLLDGHAANYVRNLLSKQCPGMWKPCTGYLVMLVGLVVTILIQSNSIFSSSLTPLVGSGVVTLEQMYPLVLGSNIGTTFSGVLAAFSTDPSRFEKYT
uniref:Na(+)-dependent phosphate cotransporter 2A n=1 Tax=Caenorhabditis tropicalis TaxID=1561998 RepID=A0A1I7UAD3_9PELO